MCVCVCIHIYINIYKKRGSPLAIAVNVLDNNIVVNEFQLHLCYYIPFQTNAFGKSINPFSYGLNSMTTALLQEWLWH